MERVFQKLPIGIEGFEKVRAENFYYVDKTEFIRELLENWGEVNLFTRPRRFGKSLLMSMLKSFFGIGCRKELFDGLMIAEDKDLCERYMGKFPVISISLKGVNGDNYNTAREMLCSAIGTEAMKFQFLLESKNLSERERQQFAQLVSIGGVNGAAFVMSDSVLKGSLKTLTMLLEKHYGKKVIFLLDEYDVPLAKANEHGYYDQMIMLVRGLFEQVLKTNDSLFFAMLTGCLRVAKESIFTGLNNPQVFTITDVRFAQYFGFTDEEVKRLLNDYGLSHVYDGMKEWYDGYRFGNVDVYCPWDVVCYCSKLRADGAAWPEDFWSNTSGNDVVRHFVEKMDKGVTKRELESLVAGECVEKKIIQELTYNRLYDSIDHIWSVLFATGYLTQRGRRADGRYLLAIPNREIREIFTSQIMTMFKETVAHDGELLEAFCEALKCGNAENVEQLFTAYLQKTVSIRDMFVRKNIKENLPSGKATTTGSKGQNPSVCFYHGILLGILGFKGDWYVISNRQSGDGYSDIQVVIDREEIGLVIEVKYAQNMDLESECEKAIDQINKNRYTKELHDDGIATIFKYGIVCHKNRCRVAVEKEE